MTMTRSEHMRWCKQRAMEYARRGDLTNAVMSMMSDLTKHPETKNTGLSILGIIGGMSAMDGDQKAVEKWIDGFAE